LKALLRGGYILVADYGIIAQHFHQPLHQISTAVTPNSGTIARRHYSRIITDLKDILSGATNFFKVLAPSNAASYTVDSPTQITAVTPVGSWRNL